MKIEGNQKELDAMAEFHKGNRAEGLRLQEEFAAEFREEYKEKDHLFLPEGLSLSRKLQGMCGNPQSTPGTCSELYAASAQ